MRARAMTPAVLLVAVCASMLGLIPPTRQGALVAAWKDADPNIAALAEVVASAFASGMWAGRSRPCKNSAKFCKRSSRARFFAIFSTLNALRPRKSERNRLV